MVKDADEKEFFERLLEELNNCRRCHFRINDELRKKARILLTRSSARTPIHVDGYSFHDVMKTCLDKGLDGFLGEFPDDMVEDFLKRLRKNKPTRGRPRGTPNKTVKW